jgi:hypothetical protein
MIFSAKDLRHHVIRDTLKYLDQWTPAAENLLVGTAIQESGLGFAIKEGRHLGLYHITANAHRAVWDHYLIHHPELASRIRGLAGQHSFLEDPHGELITNLKFATAVAWSIYCKSGKSLPEADDIQALARFWHTHFHSKPTGTVNEFVRNYRDLSGGDSGSRLAA